jgi:cysteine synthase A
MTEIAVCPDIADAVALPRPVRLGPDNLIAVPFFLMKMLPAAFILRQAAEAGRLRRGSLVIETTSGTFGLALAILCNLLGYRLILVSDPAIDTQLRLRLEDLGARVEIVTEPAAVGGFQAARLARMAELQARAPDHFWPSQYHTPHNWGAYAPLAAMLAELLGRVDCLVGTVGSGGSMTGTAHYLRLVRPELRCLGVDTFGSVLFGQPDGPRALRGLGNSIMPRVLDHRAFDEAHWVSAPVAFRATRQLHGRHSVYAGPTSGAAYLVARRYALDHPERTVVVLCPDEGVRYATTVYSDDYLRRQGLWLDESAMPERPIEVSHPTQAAPPWACLAWGRRSYEEVVGRPFSPGGRP